MNTTQLPNSYHLNGSSSNERNIVLWFVTALLFALFAPTLLWLFQRWTLSVWHNGHGILVSAIVIYLIWKELKKNERLPISTNGWGFLILIPALLLHILDTGLNSQLLSAFAILLALPGLSLLFLGTERTKAILFPLCTLLLTLPIPLVFTESLHMLLRQIATKSVAWLLKLFGIPVFSHGTSIEVENGSLMVADACSGFSTLYASITIAILTAYFCKNTYRKILVLLIAVPLAVSVNIIRVLVLVLLVNWFGLDVLATSAHELSGLLTFMVALPIIFYLGNDSADQHNENETDV